MKVEIYSDLVCPWCYIGERRFESALEQFEGAEDVEVVFRPYQLDPGAPGTAVPLKNYLATRYGSRAEGMLTRVTEAAAGEGISIDWDAAQAVNTLTAHRLIGLAEREHGAAVQRALTAKLFELHFTKGGDLSDHEALAELAGSVGMDRERVRAFLGTDEGVREVEAEIAAARKFGIGAVPTFVFEGQFAVQGAQPASTFLQALEEVEALTTAQAATAGGESCADGVCEV